MDSDYKTINRSNVKAYRPLKRDHERITFLGHVSHGIRTPLNAILGFSKLLVLKNAINPDQMKYIQGILKGGNLLMEFVDNLLDLSQFEAKSYLPTISSFDLNQALWEFTEEFYNHKIENNVSEINLMLVWDSKQNDFEIKSDSILFKKALQRLLNLVSKKYSINEFELGYREEKEGEVSIFMRPVIDKLSKDDFLKDSNIYSVSNDDSFDYFNYKVLNESIGMLDGVLSVDSSKQEFKFSLPIQSK